MKKSLLIALIAVGCVMQSTDAMWRKTKQKFGDWGQKTRTYFQQPAGPWMRRAGEFAHDLRERPMPIEEPFGGVIERPPLERITPKEATRIWTGARPFIRPVGTFSLRMLEGLRQPALIEGPFGGIVEPRERITPEAARKLARPARLIWEPKEVHRRERQAELQRQYERKVAEQERLKGLFLPVKREQKAEEAEEELGKEYFPTEEEKAEQIKTREKFEKWWEQWKEERPKAKKAEKVKEEERVTAGGKRVNPAQVARWEAKEQELKDKMLEGAQEREGDWLNLSRIDFERRMGLLAKEKLRRSKKVAEWGEDWITAIEDLRVLRRDIDAFHGPGSYKDRVLKLHKRWKEVEEKHGPISYPHLYQLSPKEEKEFRRELAEIHLINWNWPPHKSEVKIYEANEAWEAVERGIQAEDIHKSQELKKEFPFLATMEERERKGRMLRTQERIRERAELERKRGGIVHRWTGTPAEMWPVRAGLWSRERGPIHYWTDKPAREWEATFGPQRKNKSRLGP